MLILNIVNIEQVDHTKFVGVIINDRSDWNDHIKTVCTKLNKNTCILYRTRKNLNTNTLLLLYQTLIQPCLEYLNIVISFGLLMIQIFSKYYSKSKRKRFEQSPLGNGTVILRKFEQGYTFKVYII